MTGDVHASLPTRSRASRNASAKAGGKVLCSGHVKGSTQDVKTAHLQHACKISAAVDPTVPYMNSAHDHGSPCVQVASTRQVLQKGTMEAGWRPGCVPAAM